MANNTTATAYNDAYNVDSEKDIVTHKEDINGSAQDDYECEFTPAEQRKIIHRVDRRLVVTVGVLYCISLMDRTNLSAAAIAGYVKENTTKRGICADRHLV
jgi:DNA replication initiation complex subunit (GINS family)